MNKVIKMKNILIAAVSQNNVIGKDNKLPWKIPEDLKFFKEITWGNCVIMGRKTYESLPDSFKPLPFRTNIVLTKDKNFQADGCHVTNTVEKALEFSKNNHENKSFIIGGKQIYDYVISKDLIDEMYITWIYHDFDGDTYFPDIITEEWQIKKIKSVNTSEKNPYNFEILKYTKCDAY